MNETSSPTANDPDSAAKDGNGRKSKRFSQVFWLAFLVLSLAYAWYSFYVPATDVAWADDFAAAQQVAAESDKPMMLFFTAEWCVPCRIMKRELFANAEMASIINSNVVPLMLDADDPAARAWFQQYNVQGTPVTIITDAKGMVINYAVGGIGESQFLELIGVQ